MASTLTICINPLSNHCTPIPWSPESATASLSAAVGRKMCSCFSGLTVLSFKNVELYKYTWSGLKWEVMLNVLGVSLSVLSHFLPPQCMPLIFSPCFILGSDWRRVADYCLVFRGGDSGRSAAVRSFSRLCLTGCETHPEWRRSSVHDGCMVIVHDGLRYILDENRNNPGPKDANNLDTY